MGLGNLSIEENAFFYSLNPHKTAVYEQNFVFDEKIDREQFTTALKETVKYFDRFTLKPVISKEGKPEFILNTNPFPIYDDLDQKVMLGTKDTNGYLYAIFIKDNAFRITLVHLLCDARGARAFLFVLLSKYIMLHYDENELFEEIKKLDLENISHKKNSSDIISPYAKEKLKDEIEKPLEFPSAENVFVVDKEVKDFYKDYYYTTSIEFDINKFLDIVHKYDAKPFIFFFMMIAEAMIESYDFKEEKVVANVAVDLRNYLKSNSFYNFGTTVNVDYLKEWHKLPIEEKISHLKENFAYSLDYDESIANMYKVEQMMTKISTMQNIDWLIKQRKENEEKIRLPLFTCFISNVGKSVFPNGISKHLKKFYGNATPINVVPDYTIFTVGDKGVLTQNQNFQNEKTMLKVFEMFKAFGIDAKYLKEEKMELSHFDTLKLDRM